MARPNAQEILSEAKALQEYMLAIRRDIHAHPELGGTETRTQALILRELESLLSDLPVEGELVTEGEESFITSEDQPMYGTLRRVLEELYPRLQLVPTLVTGAEDARHYSNLSDCILRFSPLTLGPRGGGSDHGGNEFLSEQSLGLAAEFYETFFKKL